MYSKPNKPKMRNVIICWAALRYASFSTNLHLRIKPHQNKGFVLIVVLIFILIINLVLAHYLARNEQFIKTNAHQTQAIKIHEAT